jgi:hypothetical protein
MGRKGKTQNHTAKELAGKAAAAKYAAGGAGGGGSGAAKRKDAGSKAAVLCEICKGMQPNMKSMILHYESKHPKANWAEAGPKYEVSGRGIACVRQRAWARARRWALNQAVRRCG